jgi:uncharacterized membrane protein YbhN (UPF0104 family)
VPRGRVLGRWILRVSVSAGIVAYILVDVDRDHLLGALTAVRPAALVVPLALYLAGQVLSAVKWSLLGRAVGFARPMREYVRFYYVGMFFNVFGLSTLGGDLVRALFLSDGRRPVAAVNSVVFDRASGLAILMALGAIALLLFPEYAFPWPLQLAVVVGGLALVVGWWMCPRLVRLLPPSSRVRRQVEDDLAPFWSDRGLLLRVSALSLAFHLLQVGVQWFIARAAGAALPLSYCLVIHPLLSVMMALPVSVGGFGVREGGYLYFLTRLDVDDSVAVTAGLLWFAVTALGGLVGGAVFLATGAALPRLRAPRPLEEERGAA